MWRYVDGIGIAFDRLCNTLIGGSPDQTVSMHCAVSWRDGRPFGCIMCWLLSVFVQRDHCAKQFDDQPTDVFSFIRAGLAFFFVLGSLALIVERVWRML
jgi:hypothetical protein